MKKKAQTLRDDIAKSAAVDGNLFDLRVNFDVGTAKLSSFIAYEMYWGHAVSKDMVHWKELPHALRPNGKRFDNRHRALADGACFSGGGFVDGRIFEERQGLVTPEGELLPAGEVYKKLVLNESRSSAMPSTYLSLQWLRSLSERECNHNVSCQVAAQRRPCIF